MLSGAIRMYSVLDKLSFIFKNILFQTDHLYRHKCDRGWLIGQQDNQMVGLIGEQVCVHQIKCC